MITLDSHHDVGRILRQAHALYGVIKKHEDGLVDLTNESQARNEIALLSRQDADTGGMLRQLLTYYDPRPIVTEYQEYQYADPQGFVPRKADGMMVGVSEIVKTTITQTGRWASTGETSRNAGRVDVGRSEIIYASKYKTASIGYSSEELDRLQFAQMTSGRLGIFVDTVREKVQAATEKYQEFLNETMAFGIPGMDIYGLHTHPNIVRINNVPYRPGATRTPEENIALFTYAINVMNTLTKNRHSPDIVIGDRNARNELSMQFVGSNASISTLDYILRNSSIKAFISTPEAEIASRERGPILHFMRRDMDTEGMVTKAMTQIGPPNYHNGEWIITWDASVSGVHVTHPYKHVILELPA